MASRHEAVSVEPHPSSTTISEIEETLPYISPEAMTVYPEVIANSPLENTTLIYAIPAMNEWRNGNLLRLLRGALAQRPLAGQAVEFEITINSGRAHDVLGRTGPIPPMPKHYNALVPSHDLKPDFPTNQEEYQNMILQEEVDARQLLQDNHQALDFLRRIVKVQELTRSSSTPVSDQELKKIYNQTADLLQRQVLQLAADKAQSISIVAVNAAFIQDGSELSDMGYLNDLGGLRSFGADFARSRFDNPQAVISLFDADTVPAFNSAAAQLQQIYQSHPDVQYFFSGLTNLPAGSEPELVADAPGENVRRTTAYNDAISGSPYHGSPQISFRLGVYDKLKVIRSFMWTGWEDADTAYRLVYQFGNIQQSLMLDNSLEFPPTVMTADRLDGAVDSAARAKAYQEGNGARFVGQDIGRLLDLRDRTKRQIDQLDADAQEKARRALDAARTHFNDQERKMLRFNRLVLKAFITAAERGYITPQEPQPASQEESILTLTGGEALLQYLKSNPGVVTAALQPQNLQYIKALLSNEVLIDDLQLTPFQDAIREYAGSFVTLDQLLQSGVIEDNRFIGPLPPDTPDWRQRQIIDHRPHTSSESIMHASIAESLAYLYVQQIFFEYQEFIKEHATSDIDQWPADPEQQDLGVLPQQHLARQQAMRDNLNVNGTAITRPIPEAPIDQIPVKSFPAIRALRRLLRRNPQPSGT